MPDFDGLDAIGDINAFMESVVAQPTLGDGLQLGSLEKCIAELGLTLAKLKAMPDKDQQGKSALLEALKVPINQIGGALNDLFVPNDEDLPEDTGPAIQAYAAQVAKAMQNPLLAFVQTQEAVFQQGMEKVGTVFMGSNIEGAPKGYLNQVRDTTHFLFTQLFWDSKKAASNIAGMLWFAVSEAIPATDVELRYLRRMKKAVRSSMEGLSNLPPNMEPGIPNLWAAKQLCEVEGHLKRVANDLQTKGTWNKGEFGSATTKLCDTADVLKDGILPIQGREFVKNLTGWDDRQLNSLESLAFLPDIGFRMKLIELTTLNRYLQQQDTQIKTFYNNLKTFLDAIRSLTRVDLGDVLAIIVMLLRNHVSAIQADINAQGQGFLSAQAGKDFSALESSKKIKVETDKATGQKRIVGSGATAEEIQKSKEAATDDIYSYISSQATNYAGVAALCFIFQRVQSIQGVLQKLLDVNNATMNAVLKFVDYFNAEECGDPEGATAINDSLYAYLQVIDQRLRGTGPSNAVLADRAKGLLQRIEAHEQFLHCIQKRLTFGNTTFLVATLAISTMKNILAMVNSWKDLKESLKSLTLFHLPVDAWSTRNLLDTLLKALQCLIARCDNPMMSNLARLAEDQFRSQRDSVEVRGINAAAFDVVPAESRKSSAGTRMAAFFRLYQALMQLVNMDLTILCDIKFDQNKKMDETKAAPETSDRIPQNPPEDRAKKLATEQAEREKAAAAGIPFESGESTALA